jgi:hypothetical protein
MVFSFLLRNSCSSCSLLVVTFQGNTMLLQCFMEAISMCHVAFRNQQCIPSSDDRFAVHHWRWSPWRSCPAIMNLDVSPSPQSQSCIHIIFHKSWVIVQVWSNSVKVFPQSCCCPFWTAVLLPVSVHVLHWSVKLYDESFEYNIIYIFAHISAKFHSKRLQDERYIIVFLVLAVPAVSAAFASVW